MGWKVRLGDPFAEPDNTGAERRPSGLSTAAGIVAACVVAIIFTVAAVLGIGLWTLLHTYHQSQSSSEACAALTGPAASSCLSPGG